METKEDAQTYVPRPVKTCLIDDPKRGIETKIMVYDMAFMHPIVVDYSAQVYRRREGLGDWNVVHTVSSAGTGSFLDDVTAELRARAWHRANPTVVELRAS